MAFLKKKLYFLVAAYFAFWAKLRLGRWRPVTVVVTGSSGKTTLFKLLAAQLGTQAYYSCEANSAFGIPFNILDLKRKSFLPYEYLVFALKAPFLSLLARVPTEKLYVAECDCDRPGEGKFLAQLLQPDYTLWLNANLTHSMNFDGLVRAGNFTKVEEAIAAEFGHLAVATRRVLWVNGDDQMIVGFLQNQQPPATVERLKAKDFCLDYAVTSQGTKFVFKDATVKLRQLVPAKVGLSVLMTQRLLAQLNQPFDASFKNLELEPGRSTLFSGVKRTALIDSTYNATWDGVQEMLALLQQFPGKKKWVVLGDMLEQGERTAWAHRQLAKKLVSLNLERVILVGPRLREFAYPLVSEKYGDRAKSVLYPREVVKSLIGDLSGGEVILFKGARFLEGLVEKLLLDKSQAKLLTRREKHWQKRRAKFY